MDMDMDVRMGMESMGNSIIVDRSCRRTGCDGLMGEGKRRREMEEHTGIENEGNEEEVMEEEEGHAAVIFQGSTYLFFSWFFLFFGVFWGVLSKVPVCIMHACMYATGLVLLYTCDQIWRGKKGKIGDWRLV